MAVDSVSSKQTALEAIFCPVQGKHHWYQSNVDGPYGKKKIIYADWTASGRLYRPIEEKLSEQIGSFVANTHTETSFTGKMMTKAYHEAKHIIKKHVNASPADVLITAGTGMTGAVIKFQRILGLKIPEKGATLFVYFQMKNAPLFLYHTWSTTANQTSWLETIAKVELIQADANGLVDLKSFGFLAS
jgi:selenocysteine lyase/cysteine desulfurase